MPPVDRIPRRSLGRRHPCYSLQPPSRSIPCRGPYCNCARPHRAAATGRQPRPDAFRSAAAPPRVHHIVAIAATVAMVITFASAVSLAVIVVSVAVTAPSIVTAVFFVFARSF